MSNVDKELNKILKELGATTKDEALAKAIQELSDLDKVKMFSEVFPPLEDETLACMLVIAERYRLSWLKSFLIEKLQLRVSLLRQGRKEYVDIAIGERKAKQPILGWLRRRKEEKEGS